MKLRQLEFFVAVARCGGVTKAAQRLNVAQPALTRHIKKLESDLGVSLFLKDGRGVALTEAGAEFLAKVSAILQRLREAETSLARHTKGGPVQLKCGVPSSLGTLLAERLIDSSRDCTPSIVLNVVDGWSRFIIDWLLSEQLDLGIIYDNTTDDMEIATQYLVSETHFLVGHRTSHLAERRSISLAEIASLSMILPSLQHGLRKTIDAQMWRIGCSVTPAMELDASPTIKALIERGGIHGILSQSDVAYLSPSLFALEIVDPPLIRDLFIAWRKDTRRLPWVQQMVVVIASEADKLVGRGTWGTRRARDGSLLGQDSARSGQR